MAHKNDLGELCKLIRYYILTSTSEAGSGHPTSSLSAVELMATLFFGGLGRHSLGEGGFLRQNTADFSYAGNDRVIFSKGHAAPLLYSLYTAVGVLTQKELITLRKFGSKVQGHPTPDLPFVDVATGSLGQGLSVGLGMALGIRLRIKRGEINIKREPTIWVLMGDSEVAEGQVWEAMETASKYKVNNLVGILDINRLGQNGETELSWDLRTYESRIKSFGWDTIVVKNGHNLDEVTKAFEQANSLNTIKRQKPLIILARTVKGKGISFLEDKEGWHGKVLSNEELNTALKELGKVDLKVRGEIKKPEYTPTCHPDQSAHWRSVEGSLDYARDDKKDSFRDNFKLNQVLDKLAVSAHIQTDQRLIATREAFGNELLKLGGENEKIVVLDAEVGNSTYVNKFGKEYPDRFFQMYIDEANMVSVALGLSKMGFIPYLSTFAAFLTRAFDQIRMAQYSFVDRAIGGTGGGVPDSAQRREHWRGGEPRQNLSHGRINIIGSHTGVSIGPDGPSQMGLEDIAMMRSINHSTVLYPSDAVSTAKLTKEMATNPGINYLRTTRGATPIIYDEKEEFPIGGCKVHYPSTRHPNQSAHWRSMEGSLDYTRDDNQVYKAVIIAAGITLHAALKAQKELAKKNVNVIVVDLYSIKPLDTKTLKELVKKCNHIIVVEDHYEAGGIGEAILSALFKKVEDRKSKMDIEDRKLKLEKNRSSNLYHQNSNLHPLPSILKFSHLCVRKTPCSGTPEELLRYEEIDVQAIKQAVLKSV